MIILWEKIFCLQLWQIVLLPIIVWDVNIVFWTWNTLLQALPIFKVPLRDQLLFWWVFHCVWFVCFSLSAFNILSLFCKFSVLTMICMICQSDFQCWSYLLGVLCAFGVCMDGSFLCSEKFSSMILLKFCSLSLTLNWFFSFI